MLLPWLSAEPVSSHRLDGRKKTRAQSRTSSSQQPSRRCLTGIVQHTLCVPQDETREKMTAFLGNAGGENTMTKGHNSQLAWNYHVRTRTAMFIHLATLVRKKTQWCFKLILCLFSFHYLLPFNLAGMAGGKMQGSANPAAKPAYSSFQVVLRLLSVLNHFILLFYS